MIPTFRLGSTTRSRCPAFQGSSLILTQTSPNAAVLVGVKSILETGFGHWAARANVLRSVDLFNSRPCVSYREKELGIHTQARCTITPIQDDLPSKTTWVLRQRQSLAPRSYRNWCPVAITIIFLPTGKANIGTLVPPFEQSRRIEQSIVYQVR
jgi:hypothetical protein